MSVADADCDGTCNRSARSGSTVGAHQLDAIFHARSVALVGLSSDSRKMTGAPLGILRQNGFTGAIFPINPRTSTIDGLPCYPDISALPEIPDAALIMLAAGQCAQAVRDCAAKGIKAVVVLSSGFEESQEGMRHAQALALAANETKTAVVGPNCEGVWSVRKRLLLTFGSAAKRDTLYHSPIAVISQSGAMAGAVARHLQNNEIGCSYVVSVGNETVLTVSDYLEWMIEQDDVRVVLLFIEGLRDGQRLLHLIGRAIERGIRIVALKSGNSAAGMEAAASHTGKIASAYSIYHDLLEDAGAILIQSLTELIAAGEVLSAVPLPVYRPSIKTREADGTDGVAVFSIPGGTRSMTADQCDTHGVPLSKFAQNTVKALKAALPEFGGVQNPTDLTGQVLTQPGLFDRCLSIISNDPHTEALIIQVANRGPSDVMSRLPLLDDVVKKTGCPVIISFLGDSLSSADRSTLRNLGIICARDPAEAALYLGWLYKARNAQLNAGCHNESLNLPIDTLQPESHPAEVPSRWPDVSAWVEAAGIPVPPWTILRPEQKASEACVLLSAPLAVKALPEDVAHKSELGLLSLNLATTRQVEQEAQRIRSVMQRPDANILVQQMVAGSIEVLLAAVRNPDFGPVLALGMGGTSVELFRDIAWLALPTDIAKVTTALARLKLNQLLCGFRGKPAADIPALIDAVINLGNRFVATGSNIAEIEINPLLVQPLGKGVTAVDILIRPL